MASQEKVIMCIGAINYLVQYLPDSYVPAGPSGDMIRSHQADPVNSSLAVMGLAFAGAAFANFLVNQNVVSGEALISIPLLN